MKFLILLTSINLFSSGISEERQELAKALATGDATTIAAYFDQNVEVCLLDQTQLLNANQAKNLLEEFFTKNSPSSYQQIHKGDSRGTSSYTIGLLTTQTGVYRIYLYYTLDHSVIRIKELRVDLK